MNHDSTFDKIEAWLDGELPDNEARAFELEVGNDPNLAAEVEQHKLARQAIERLVELDMDDNLARWRENMDDLPEPPLEDSPNPADNLVKKSSPLRWVFGLALLLIIVAGAFWILWPSGPENSKTGKQPQQKESKPPKPDVPVANTPVTLPEQENPAPITQPKASANQRPAVNPELIAMADAQLKQLRESVDLQYGSTMGSEEEENALFTAGLKAYKSTPKKFGEVIQNLQKIKPDDEHYTASQELLALAYLGTKNYRAAARCYETFALKNNFPEVDWRLVQFYLADYGNRKADFWRKMEAILAPGAQHLYKDDAIKLKEALKLKGITKE